MSRLVMVAALACVLVLGSGAAPSPAAGQGQDVSVKVVGIAVWEPYGGENEMPVFFMPEGTTVALLVTCPGKNVVKMDADGSALKVMRDDQGADLREARPANLSMFEQPIEGDILEGGKGAIVKLHARKTPGKGSNRVKAEGVLKLGSATQLATATQRDVPLKKGTTITVGPVPLEITEVAAGAVGSAPSIGVAPGGSDFEKTVSEGLAKAFEGAMAGAGPSVEAESDFFFGPPAMQITLRAKADISSISRIKFSDASGAVVKHQVMSESRMGGGSAMWVTQEIGLAKKIESAQVTIEYWKDLTEKEVPFSVEAGLSLQ